MVVLKGMEMGMQADIVYIHISPVIHLLGLLGDAAAGMQGSATGRCADSQGERHYLICR